MTRRRVLLLGAIAITAVGGWIVLRAFGGIDRHGTSASAGEDLAEATRSSVLAAMPARRMNADEFAAGERAQSPANEGMPKATGIRGLVVDDAGPVAEVTLEAIVLNGERVAHVTQLLTDERGRFAYDLHLEEWETVELVATKGSRISAPLLSRAGQFEQIHLRDSGSLAGRVVDADDGRPVPTATVHARDPGTQRRIDEQAVDGAGAFALTAPVGSVRVWARAPGYTGASADFEVGLRTSRDIALRRNGKEVVAFAGVLLRHQFRVPNAHLRVPGSGRATWASTDRDGRFEIPAVDDDLLDVRVLGSFVPARVRRTGTRPDGVVEVEVDEPVPKTVNGRVVHGGVGVAGAEVFVVCNEHGRVEARTRADGRFALGHWCDVLRARIRVRTPLGLLVEVPPGDDVVVEVPPSGRVRGRVTDRDGRFVADARVEAGIDDNLTDRGGSFDLVLPLGRQRIRASSPGFASARSAAFDVVAGGVVVRDIRLDRGGTLFGRVVDEHGAPVAQAIVRVTGEPTAVRSEDAVRSAPDGSWVSRDVAGTTFRVTASADGYAEVTVDGIAPDSWVPPLVLRRR